MNDGAVRIMVERNRQQTELGWSKSRDYREHDSDQLAQAALFYLEPDSRHWPWDNHDKEWEKNKAEKVKSHPAHRIKNLVKAGALIAAEIDRLSYTTAWQQIDDNGRAK